MSYKKQALGNAEQRSVRNANIMKRLNLVGEIDTRLKVQVHNVEEISLVRNLTKHFGNLNLSQ